MRTPDCWFVSISTNYLRRWSHCCSLFSLPSIKQHPIIKVSPFSKVLYRFWQNLYSIDSLFYHLVETCFPLLCFHSSIVSLYSWFCSSKSWSNNCLFEDCGTVLFDWKARLFEWLLSTLYEFLCVNPGYFLFFSKNNE